MTLNTDPLPAGALTGIRVIEFRQMANLFAGLLFGDLGADVEKIERPDGGDGMQQWRPLTGESDSALFGGT